jgi:adenylate cyclase
MTQAVRHSGRRLAAVLVADVAGYVRLVEADEDGVHQRIFRLRREIIDPAVAEAGGRVVKNTGDGFFATFDTVREAFECAQDMQGRIAKVESRQAKTNRIAFRMAVNLCELIDHEGDVYGDGVNVAARLQHFAPAGGLALSAAAREQLGRQDKLAINDLGYLQLKHLERPVRAFSVNFSGDVVEFGPAPSVEIAKPSIAVLPFRSLQHEADDAYFAAGIAEDIVGALTGLSDLMVISHGSTRGYVGDRVDPRAVRRDLGVRYMLAGSMRRQGGKVRIHTELSDTETGAVVHSERFDGISADLFELQDQITSQIVSIIAPHVRDAELRRVRRKRPENMDAYDLVLRASDLMYRLNSDDFNAALPLLKRAIELDPNYAKAYAMAAKWHGLTFGQGWSDDPKGDAAETDRLASEAIARDSGDALALALCGHHRAFLFRDYGRAIALFDRALAAGPNSALAWTLSSPTYSYIGDTTQAIARANRGLRLSPLDPDAFWYQTTLTLAHYAAGDYEHAVEYGRKVAAAKPIFTANLRFLAASLAALDRDSEAHEVAHLVMNVEPRFHAVPFTEGYAFREATSRQRFREHLIKAGLPE